MRNELRARAEWLRLETLRIHLANRETRIASSLSPIEIFVALFYGGILNFDPKHPLAKDRDRLIISKGHGSICFYPILVDFGFIDKIELDRIGKKGGILGGIPDPIIPGYETINGSLGHGPGVACGVAKALKTRGATEQVFVLCGDGELHEGSCWEAIMFAQQHKLDNLNFIIDNNQISMLDHTAKVVDHIDLAKKFNVFGWEVLEVDGHDVFEVRHELEKMKRTLRSKPKVLIAQTVKGKGVPGLENHPLCHIINPDQTVLEELLNAANYSF